MGHIVDALGRLSRTNTGKHGSSTSDRWGFTQSSTLDFSGRHVLPIWRILKEDLKLTGYTFENIAFHVLRYRCDSLSPVRWADSMQDPALLARNTHAVARQWEPTAARSRVWILAQPGRDGHRDARGG